jgi:hypothetical protein
MAAGRMLLNLIDRETKPKLHKGSYFNGIKIGKIIWTQFTFIYIDIPKVTK